MPQVNNRFNSDLAGFPTTIGSPFRQERGCVQTLRLLGAAGSGISAAYTFSSAWMMEGDYDAVRFLYANPGGGWDVTAAKTAASPDLTNNGTGLTWSSVTFDKSATAMCGDTWDGSVGATATYTMPAGSGSGANAIPALVWTDWVAQQSVPCTEVGSTDLRIVFHRLYSASTSYSAINTGTSASNMGNYNSNSRRKSWGQLTAGNQVSTINAVSLQANWQWMPCIGAQALLRKLVYNHGMFGDSITKGQGSFDDNNGVWGWAQRAPQAMTDSGVIGTHSVVNYAVAGQRKSASWTTCLGVLDQRGLDTAILFPWSPNDGIAAGSAPWNLSTYKFQVNAFIASCRKNGIAPIIATQPPSVTITDAVSDAIRVAFNNDIRALETLGVAIADFDRVLSNKAAPARYITGLTNTDNQHPSSAGHEAMSQEYQRAVRFALGI